MNGAGQIPLGAVSAARVLRTDAAAPFGVVLDQEKVVREFDDAWAGDAPRVVLVEASDLSRAEEYAPSATPAEAERHRREALERSDALVGGAVGAHRPGTRLR